MAQLLQNADDRKPVPDSLGYSHVGAPQCCGVNGLIHYVIKVVVLVMVDCVLLVMTVLLVLAVGLT